MSPDRRRRPVMVAGIVAITAMIGACGDASAAPAATAVTAPPELRAEATPVITAVPTSAAAAQPAVRLDPPLSDCQTIAIGVARSHPGTTTQVLVRTVAWSDTTATLELAELVGNTWVCGAPMIARVGRNGVRPLSDRRSGDGTTPAGVFALATMTAPDGQRFSFFGNAADPGVTAGTYRRVQIGDCFGATAGTAGYGHLRYDTSCPGPDDEYLPNFPTTYSNAALIGANMEPDVSGDAPGETPYASAIFLHRFTYVSGQAGATKPTSGCVSLAQPDLSAVLTGMDAGTQFVIGPTQWLLDTVAASS
jgi:L,D-peptidoglycan transpeptidase YkuD (ErfK/YbiS/YcfS/YnhG family)